ncbi:SCO family protein [Paludisphaera mucosa]|uniref:SCO family protein n=1 Tax=Paludisphaera mucosa TaxID=3030827 RepID=A0ABT6F4T2_9BACT|nr:SCO family protein [Paludisphaera mucosa]
MNHFGERLRFREAFLDGRALIVNMMFTVCKGTCPGASAALRGLREALGPVFGERLTIVSITLEPRDDSPAALQRCATIYGAGRRRPELCDWQFVTGRPASVERLRRSLGFYDLDPRIDADVTQHGELLLFGNSTSDRWSALPASLRPALLIETIRRVSGFTFEQRYGIRA